jgi:hypothetical protein
MEKPPVSQPYLRLAPKAYFTSYIGQISPSVVGTVRDTEFRASLSIYRPKNVK